MAGSNTAFDEFIASEVKKYKGVYVPVKAGILQRALIRWTPCASLHPNPDDEFCSPKVGPNYQIISEYMYSFRLERQSSKQFIKEPLTVQKIRPDGYMILNGHHRWAAALQLGFRRIPIEIVDLTQEMDIRNILQYSKHDKRVTLDLDEVVTTAYILAMDTKNLCSDDCKGLCAKCGADLNLEACRCKPEVDPRLAALAQLLDNKT